MSELVISEIESIRSRELEMSISLLEKNIKSIDSMCERSVRVDMSTIATPYSFKYLLEQKLDPDSIKYIDYNLVLQKEVVKRAIARIRPFKECEKGYRDTLMWLSLLDYLSVNKIKDDVAFISNNSDDFLNSKKTDFHNDLIKDMDERNLTCNITPYNSLFSFVAAKVNKNEHLMAYNELDQVEDIIEECTIDFLNDWSTEELKKSLQSDYPQISSLLSIDNHDFIIDEGMEDGIIVNMKHIKGNMTYVSYRYNLRICTLKIIISREEYSQAQYTLPSSHNVKEVGDDYSEIEIYTRIYLLSSFEYNMENKTIEGFIVNSIKYR